MHISRIGEALRIRFLHPGESNRRASESRRAQAKNVENSEACGVKGTFIAPNSPKKVINVRFMPQVSTYLEAPT